VAFEGYVVTKILHVFLAVAWIGAALYQQILVQPVLGAVDPAARRQVAGRLMPQSIRYNNIVGGLTVLTGIGLVSMHPEYGWSDLLTTFWGRLVSFSLVGALAMLYLLNVAIRPTLRTLQDKMGELREGEEPSAGLQLLQKRLVFSGRLALIIGLIVLAAMVVANTAGYLQSS